MPKGVKRKAKTTNNNARMENRFQDTTCTTGVPPEIKWGDVYRMVRDQDFPEALIEEECLYQNIRNSCISKASTRPELFPCSEVIGWILQQANAETRVLTDNKGIAFASFHPSYISTAYKLPKPQQRLDDAWLEAVKMDNLEMAKRLLIVGKQIRKKDSEEYEVQNLRPPFRLIALMLSRIFGRPDGTMFMLQWIPIIHYVAFQGTIFNWADILSDSLASAIITAQEGLVGRNAEYYMGSYLIDCIVAKCPFPRLGCIWNSLDNSVFIAYKIFWAQHYKRHYKLVCEEFIMPLYELMFNKEPNCLSKNAMQVLEKYGDFYFSPEGTYIRMYGGSKTPYILPRYPTDYIVHKEMVRQVFIDGIGNALYKAKKASFPPLPFYVGAYKFSKIATAEEFVTELKSFHFGERIFHRNDQQGKAAEHCKEIGTPFEYAHFYDRDEEPYRGISNLSGLQTCQLGKGGAASSSNVIAKLDQQQEKSALKTVESLSKEGQRSKEKAKKIQEKAEKNIKAKEDKILEEKTLKDQAHEAEAIRVQEVEKTRLARIAKQEEEEKLRREQEEEALRKTEEEKKQEKHTSPQSPNIQELDINVSIEGLPLVAFTPSRGSTVSTWDRFSFNRKRKYIIKETITSVKRPFKPDIVTRHETTIMQGTQNDPKLMASISVTSVMATIDNVNILGDELKQEKEKTRQLQEALVKENNYTNLMIEKNVLMTQRESLNIELQQLEADRRALAMQARALEIVKGELEDKNLKLEEGRESLELQLQQATSKIVDMHPFHEQACELTRAIYGVQQLITEEICKLKTIRAKIVEIAREATRCKRKYMRIIDDIQKQMQWREGKFGFPANLLFKSISGFNSDIRLLGFCKEYGIKLSDMSVATIEQCNNLYLRMQMTQEKCLMKMPQTIEEFPESSLRLAELKDGLDAEIEYIRKVDTLTVQDLDHWIGQATVHKYILEESLWVAKIELLNIEEDLTKHEVSLKTMLPLSANNAIKETIAWENHIEKASRASTLNQIPASENAPAVAVTQVLVQTHTASETPELTHAPTT